MNHPVNVIGNPYRMREPLFLVVVSRQRKLVRASPARYFDTRRHWWAATAWWDTRTGETWVWVRGVLN
jgi:hypothetical protein